VLCRGRADGRRSSPVIRTDWRGLLVLLGPSLVLLAPFAFQHFGGLPYFALHTLMGGTWG